MAELKRQILMDKIMLVSLGLLVLFAWFDSQNLIGIKAIDSSWQNSDTLWGIFWDVINPAAFNMWIGVLAAIGVIWYLISKDKSESLAIFITPAIMVMSGTQDLIYYIFSPDKFVSSISCWADVLLPVRFISDLMGEPCPTPTSFFISGMLGIFVAYHVYYYLKRQKW